MSRHSTKANRRSSGRRSSGKRRSRKRRSSTQGSSSTALSDTWSLRHTELKSKEKEIELVLSKLQSTKSYPRSRELIHQLRRLATSRNGLVRNSIRKRAWPVLLGFDQSETAVPIERIAHDLDLQVAFDAHKNNVQFDEKHVNERVERIIQIRRDVDRSLFQLDHCQTWSEDQRRVSQDYLEIIINYVLDRNPTLHYYQGFHDVASVFLLTVGPDASPVLLERYSIWFLQEHQRATFDTTTNILKLLFHLVHKSDSKLFKFLLNSKVEPYFALSWILTGFAHHYNSVSVQSRLFDCLLSCHPLFPLYLSVAAICEPNFRNGLLQQECDIASVHLYLQELPQVSVIPSHENVGESSGELSVENLIDNAMQLFERCPPRLLLQAASKKTKSNSTTRMQVNIDDDLTALVAADVPPSDGDWKEENVRREAKLSLWESLAMKKDDKETWSVAVVVALVAFGVAVVLSNMDS